MIGFAKTSAFIAGLLLSGAAAAQCPAINTYPFQTGCPLPAASLNAALAAGTAHKASNTELSATATTAYSTVVRLGFAAAGDAPPVLYRASPAACSLGSGDGDGGIQVKSSDGKCWLASLGSGPADLRIWGCKFDGTTDDTPCMTTAFASGVQSFTMPADKKTVAAGLTLGAGTTLDCQNSEISPPASGAKGKWIIRRQGAWQRLLACRLSDPDSVTEVATTLSATAAPEVTSLQVASTANMAAGMPLVLRLASGIWWATKVVTVTDVTHLAILDPVPSSATAAALVSGGSGGYVTNEALVALSGTGAPLTMKAIASSGAVTGGTIQSPGLYTTVPPNPVQMQDTGSPSVTRTASAPAPGVQGVQAWGTSFNVTWAGASNGSAAVAGWGLLTSDGASEGTVTDFRTSYAPFAIVYTKGAAAQSEGEQIINFQVNNTSRLGFFKDVNVNTMAISHGLIWGTSPNFGAVGLYFNDRTPGSLATGGNRITDVTSLQFDIGNLFQATQLLLAIGLEADTNNYYGTVLSNAFTNTMTPKYASFTGPNTGGVINGYGVGLVAINAQNIGVGILQAGGQASDLHVDAASSVFVGMQNGTFGVGHRITGDGAGIFSGQQTVAQAYGTVSTSATPVYLGARQSATENDAAWRNQLYASSVVKVSVSMDTSPGAGNSWIAKLRIGGADSGLQCAIPSAGSPFTCDMTMPIRVVNANDLLAVSLTSTTPASAKVWLSVKQQ